MEEQRENFKSTLSSNFNDLKKNSGLNHFPKIDIQESTEASNLVKNSEKNSRDALYRDVCTFIPSELHVFLPIEFLNKLGANVFHVTINWSPYRACSSVPSVLSLQRDRICMICMVYMIWHFVYLYTIDIIRTISSPIAVSLFIVWWAELISFRIDIHSWYVGFHSRAHLSI